MALHCLLHGRPWASRRAQKAIGALSPFLGDPGRAAGLRRQSGHCPPSWETLGEPQTLGKPQTMGKPQGSEGNRGTEGMPTLAPRQAAGLRRQSGH